MNDIFYRLWFLLLCLCCLLLLSLKFPSLGCNRCCACILSVHVWKRARACVCVTLCVRLNAMRTTVCVRCSFYSNSDASIYKTIFGLVYRAQMYPYVYTEWTIYNSYAEIYIVQSVCPIVYSLLVAPKRSSPIRWSESMYRVLCTMPMLPQQYSPK